MAPGICSKSIEKDSNANHSLANNNQGTYVYLRVRRNNKHLTRGQDRSKHVESEL